MKKSLLSFLLIAIAFLTSGCVTSTINMNSVLNDDVTVGKADMKVNYKAYVYKDVFRYIERKGSIYDHPWVKNADDAVVEQTKISLAALGYTILDEKEKANADIVIQIMRGGFGAYKTTTHCENCQTPTSDIVEIEVRSRIQNIVGIINKNVSKNNLFLQIFDKSYKLDAAPPIGNIKRLMFASMCSYSDNVLENFSADKIKNQTQNLGNKYAERKINSVADFENIIAEMKIREVSDQIRARINLLNQKPQ